MEAFAVLAALVVMLLLVLGMAGGIAALFRLPRTNAQLTVLRTTLKQIEQRLSALEQRRPGAAAAELEAASPGTQGPAPSRAAAPPAPPPIAHEPVQRPAGVSPPFTAPRAAPVAAQAADRPAGEPSARGAAPPPALPCAEEPQSALFSSLNRGALEQFIGTRAILWAGMVMLIIGVGFFLKFMYDMGLIGERGRLLLGVIGGCVAAGLGEYFRRQLWPAMFQTFTGGAFAIFYICVYYAHHIALGGPALLFAVAGLVTAAAVVTAVAHNARSIAILGVVGGFLSPVLLSSGENHPYFLFTYIALLDLVALGAAYYRRWRALDLLCFVCTMLMYQAWFWSYFHHPDEPSQMVPALLYTTLFFLLFLVVPVLYTLVRRQVAQLESLTFLAANTAISLYSYYNILYADYPRALGFVVIGQAALVFGLYSLWRRTVTADMLTARSLLVITLALVTLAVPLQLKLYGIPLAWALEGVLFIYLGLHAPASLRAGGSMQGERIIRLGGAAALVLAVAGLVYRLPLHRLEFTPVFNRPFLAWAAVIAALGVAVWLLYRHVRNDPEWNRPMAAVGGVAAYALGCLLLSMETALYWSLPREAYFRNYTGNALALLWAVLPLLPIAAVYVTRRQRWLPLPLAAFGVGVLVYLGALMNHGHPSTMLVLNATFLCKLPFLVALWAAGTLVRQLPEGEEGRSAGLIESRLGGNALTLTGHVLLAILAAAELARWADHTALVSEKIGLSLISAGWALQAFILVWLGLYTRNATRRILGFVLFAVTVVKVFVVDLSTVEPVYRILSFMGTGVLLLAAAYFYNAYAARLLEAEKQ